MSEYSHKYKFDESKLRWHLLPIEPIEEVVRVLMHGEEKYDKESWKCVDHARDRYYDAALRHIFKYRLGEIQDEAGTHTLANAICDLIFILYMDMHPGEVFGTERMNDNKKEKK